MLHYEKTVGDCAAPVDSILIFGSQAAKTAASTCTESQTQSADMCTFITDAACPIGAYSYHITGKVTWMPDGSSAHGFTSFDVSYAGNGAHYCSADMNVSYTRQ